jgi:hypothetical protein
MFGLLVVLNYGVAFSLALVLLYFFHAAWYWHVLSVISALVLGLTPMPVQWQGPALDLGVGFVFTFLFIWGAAAPLFRHHPPTLRTHHG